MTENRTIVISHLAETVTEQDLIDVFTWLGYVASVTFTDGKHKKAILKFLVDDPVDNAVKKFNNFVLHGKRIKVKKYREKSHSRHQKHESKHFEDDDRNDSGHSRRHRLSHDNQTDQNHNHRDKNAEHSSHHRRSSDRRSDSGHHTRNRYDDSKSRDHRNDSDNDNRHHSSHDRRSSDRNGYGHHSRHRHSDRKSSDHRNHSEYDNQYRSSHDRRSNDRNDYYHENRQRRSYDHDSRRHSSYGQTPSTLNYSRSIDGLHSFQFEDSDRTFPAKIRHKIGKKERKRMLLRGEVIKEEKKWPSMRFIEDVVRRFERRLPFNNGRG